MDTQTLAIISGLSILSILFAAWIFSLVFQVNKSIRLQKVQIDLLIKIAEKHGVPIDELDGLVNFALNK